MSRFWFAIFRDPSTLYILRFFPWNSGIYWRLHSKPVNASHYVIWHLYPCLSIPISEPTHVGAKPMSDPYRCPRIPISESDQCQSHSNVWAIPMSGPYKCRSQTHVRAFQCPSHTRLPCACAFKKLIDKIWPQHEKCYRSSYCYTSHHYFWILIDKNKHTTNKLLYF